MNDANGFSGRDRELLARFGMTEAQVLADEAMAESETVPDGLTGLVKMQAAVGRLGERY